MGAQVKKRIQYTVDEGVAESAEYIMSKAGVTPAMVLSMVYAEIDRTGVIPVNPKVSDRDLATARIIKASYNQPTVRVDNKAAYDEFFDEEY